MGSESPLVILWSLADGRRQKPYRVFGEKTLADFLGLSRQRLWVGHVVVGDGREQLLLVLAVERRLPDQHLVEQDPESPPVDRLSVRLVVDDLLGKANLIKGHNSASLRLKLESFDMGAQ